MLSSFEPQKQLTIDLHSLSVKDAKASVITRIKECSKIGCYDIQIITGRGAHASKSGERGILFKNLPTWLEELEIKPLIKEVQAGTGCYIVKLHEDSKPTLATSNGVDVRIVFDEMIQRIGIEEIKRLAKSNPVYQGLLGYLTISGESTELNIAQGMHQLRTAAENGDAMSQLLLAHLHTDGTPGVARQSCEKVVNYLEQVASTDGPHVAEAKFRLGVAYLLGRGAKQNDLNAIQCLTQAANLKHPLAQLNLAKIYDEGKITPSDAKLATFYYHAAAKQGILEAQIAMGDRFLHGIGTAPSEKSAFQCRKIAAKAGDAESQYYVGDAYESAKGVDRNIDLAYESFRAAAEQGHVRARTRAAFILLTGSDFGDKFVGALWLKESVQDECPEALFLMAKFYNSGILQPFFPKNEALALEYLGKSARLGYARAQKLIFQHDLNIVDLEPYAASKWIQVLAAQGDKEAEIMFIEALVSEGKQDQISKFIKTISDCKIKLKSIYEEPTGNSMASVAAAVSGIENPSSSSSRVLTPQYSSSQQQYLNRNDNSAQSVNSLASSVASLSIDKPNAQIQLPSSKRSANKKKRKK